MMKARNIKDFLYLVRSFCLMPVSNIVHHMNTEKRIELLNSYCTPETNNIAC